MKYLVILISLLSLSTYAQEMPKYLEGATVTVTLKNGKTYTYSSEEMAVVKRSQMGFHQKASLAHVKAFQSIHKKLESGEIVKNRKNRVYFIGGAGPTGSLKQSTNGSSYEVKQKKGAVIGAGYQRKISERLNLGIQVQSNGTGSFTIGTDF